MERIVEYIENGNPHSKYLIDTRVNLMSVARVCETNRIVTHIAAA